jgi:hypothetical protein
LLLLLISGVVPNVFPSYKTTIILDQKSIKKQIKICNFANQFSR